MQIVECDNCHAKNRVPEFRLGARATCGKCRVFLPEPLWLTMARDVRRGLKAYWVFAMGAVIVVAAMFLLQSHQDASPTLSTAPPSTAPVTVVEPGWEPPAPPINSPQSRLQPIQPLAVPFDLPQKIAPVQPVMTCVPKRIRSGTKTRYTKDRLRAPLKIKTPPGDNYLLKLVEQGTKKVVMNVYIAGGDTKKFRVPLGTYEIYYAQGKIWCGEKDAFGSDTELVKIGSDLTFSQDETGYNGHDLELIPQLMGNLRSHPVSASEFSELVPAGPAMNDNSNEQ